jgi:hypothetical protein
MGKKLYAVLTGDLIGSRQLKSSGISYIEHLNKSLEYVGEKYLRPPFIYRGDSFQGVTSEPESALKDAILLRLRLISGFNVEEKAHRIDARVSIGVGEIDHLPDEGHDLGGLADLGEMNGEAFEYSGLQLDRIKKERQNLAVKTPWEETNQELNIYCRMIDRLIDRWTKKKCEAVMHRLEGHTLNEIGEMLNIDGSAVHYRLAQTDYEIVELIIRRYSDIIKNKAKMRRSDEGSNELDDGPGVQVA